jgi:asparaginyl-tRNA synthetase
MQCAEDYVRFCCKHLLDTCRQDLDFITKMIDKGAIERLQQVVETPFKRITYTEAIELLEKAVTEGHKFENKVSWGRGWEEVEDKAVWGSVFRERQVRPGFFCF